MSHFCSFVMESDAIELPSDWGCGEPEVEALSLMQLAIDEDRRVQMPDEG